MDVIPRLNFACRGLTPETHTVEDCRKCLGYVLDLLADEPPECGHTCHDTWNARDIRGFQRRHNMWPKQKFGH